MRSARILIIERDPGALRAAEVALGTAHSVCGAATASDGEARLRDWHPHLIVCELSDEGLALIERLHERRSHVEVVVTHQAGADELLARAMRAGAFCGLARPLDPQVLREVVARCVEVHDLRESARRQSERLERDLAEARKLQAAMLPADGARIEGISVAMRCRACAELGGDLADYAAAGPGRLALLVADVAGHGVQAAMLTTIVKSAFRSTAGVAFDPGRVVSAIAQGLAPFGGSRFVTLIAARIDRQQKQIEYVNAGHPAGWVFERDKVVASLEPTGPLVSSGVEHAAWPTACLPLPANCEVLLYSDGVTEAAGPRGERFGAGRLRDAIARHRGGGAALLDGILAAVAAFAAGQPPRDDLRLLTATLGLPGLA
jgi:sigma-B regulation protein RsbU (phosphoserine phosphatase)